MATPSKYKPEYCALLETHFQEGLSFESFGGAIGVDKTTLYEWVKVHPAFKKAKEVGVLRSLLYWEKLGVDAVNGRIEHFQPSTYIYTMKCRFRKYGYNEQAPADDADDFSDITNEETGKLIEMARFKRKADGGT